MDAATIQLAQAIAALGASGTLALVFVLWVLGKIHSDKETQADKETWALELTYREVLRKEAMDDRRAADERVEKLTTALKESNDLFSRMLAVNERLVEEFIRSPRARTRRGD